MDTKLMQSYLSTKFLGQKVSAFDIVDSTNTQAKLHCEEKGVTNGHVYITNRQTQGRGTDGNSWASDGDNLYLSIVFEYDDKIDTCFPLYPAVALTKLLNEHYKIEAHVKWPNDVLVGQQKIAGILCEGTFNHYMIMGMGVNINQSKFSDALTNIATSIKMITGAEINIEKFTAQLLNTYEKLFTNSTDICKEWLTLTKMIGKIINVEQDGVNKQVTVTGLSQEGFLQIQHPNGDIEDWMARRGLDISTQY